MRSSGGGSGFNTLLSNLGFEVVLLQPVVSSGHGGAGGVDDGRTSCLEASLGAIVNFVDAAANSLDTVEGLVAEPLEISQNGLRAGLCLTNLFRGRRRRFFRGLKLGELIIPLLSESLSEGLSLLLSVESLVNLSVEVVAVVVSLLLSVVSGGSGSECSVEREAHRVIDQISFIIIALIQSMLLIEAQNRICSNLTA